MRLIDADVLKNNLKRKQLNTVSQSMNDALSDLIYAVDSVPTVDAVPVVRCGECGYWHNGYCGLHSDLAGKTEPTHFDQYDFCSYCERKDEEK